MRQTHSEPQDNLASAEAASRAIQTNNLRVTSIRPLTPPATLLAKLPLSQAGAMLVSHSRQEIIRILNGQDHRLLVVVGPCSIHDPVAGLDYARRLRHLARELATDLCIVMRVYFEKPRTTVGWKGLINDPYLDGTFAAEEGLGIARQLLLDIIDLGLPAGCEFLDPISPQFISDLVTWGAIGARTTESQVHRELASGLSMPVGFKNGTDGQLQIAIDAVRASASAHSFFGVTNQGDAGIVNTSGNPDCHIVLRGGSGKPNYDATSVHQTLAALSAAGLHPGVVVDASHGNSGKDFTRQPVVVRDLAAQVAGGQHGIIGVMMESFLVDGRQDFVDRSTLVYGQSVTDACMGWSMTAPLLHELASAVRARASTPASGVD